MNLQDCSCYLNKSADPADDDGPVALSCIKTALNLLIIRFASLVHASFAFRACAQTRVSCESCEGVITIPPHPRYSTDPMSSTIDKVSTREITSDSGNFISAVDGT